MTVTELIKGGMQTFNELTGKELQRALKAVQKSLYQRVSRLKKSGVDSPATRGLEKSGGFISARKGTEAQMKSELQRGLNFLQSKTSTITGAREYRREHHEYMVRELNLPPDTPEDNITRAIELYEQIKEEFNAEILNQIYDAKYRQAGEDIITSLVENPSEENIKSIRDKMEKAYKNFIEKNETEVNRIKSGL